MGVAELRRPRTWRGESALDVARRCDPGIDGSEATLNVARGCDPGHDGSETTRLGRDRSGKLGHGKGESLDVTGVQATLDMAGSR